MKNLCHVSLLGLCAVVVSGCDDKRSTDETPVRAVQPHAPAAPAHDHTLAARQPGRTNATLRWTVLGPASVSNFMAAQRNWNSLEGRTTDLQAQPAALAYFESDGERTIERTELAAVLLKKGLMLQRLVPIDLGDQGHGYAVECTSAV